MAKQQTLTIVVPDGMPDPADLVTRALERYDNRTVAGPDRLDDVEPARLIVLIEEP